MITSNMFFSARKALRCAAHLNRLFKKNSFDAAAVTMKSTVLSSVYGGAWFVKILSFSSDGRIENG